MNAGSGKKITRVLAAAAALLLFHGIAHAAGQSGDADDAGGIPVISGGVGEEMDYLKSVEHKYNLKLMFTEANGIYLSDIPVTIRDAKGKTVVDTVSEGPILLVKLPAGAYRVTAVSENASRTQKLSVPRKGLRSYHFLFPAHDPEYH